MTSLSLRARLLAGMLALVLVALALFGLGTVALLRSYQLDRADTQLTDLAQRQGPQSRDRGRFARPQGQAITSSTQYLDPDTGESLLSMPAGYEDDPDPLPDLPPLTAGEMGPSARPFTVGALGNPGFRYRVLAKRVKLQFRGAAPQDAIQVLGVPLNRDDATINRLLVLEGAGAVAVMAGVALIGFRVIGVGLRPLDDMTDTATAIAGGHLSNRVDVPPERADEVGRLGRALNSMLSQIEAAFGERQRSEARLRQFVGDASHELRTPLTSIRGYAELHRRGVLTSPDAVDDAMRRIENEAVRMGTLVNDLLQLARLDEGRALEQKPVDLSAVVADAVRDLQAVAPERSVTFTPGSPVVVLGDGVRLHQVVANLLDNARVHTPADAAVAVAVGADAGRAVVTVHDQGPGLAPAIAARIFERSFRGDRTSSPSGSGLGLSIVAAIVAAHGGTVSVDSAPGRGSTFTVVLPLPPGPPPPPR